MLRKIFISFLLLLQFISILVFIETSIISLVGGLFAIIAVYGNFILPILLVIGAVICFPISLISLKALRFKYIGRTLSLFIVEALIFIFGINWYPMLLRKINPEAATNMRVMHYLAIKKSCLTAIQLTPCQVLLIISYPWNN